MAEKPGEYEFTLVIENGVELTPQTEDALFAAGCDDATISLQHGLLCLDFTRTAYSLEDAILSAISDVENSGIGARVLRVDECGLVSQAEIARRIQRSRQLVGQYISAVRGPGGFPAPQYGLAGKSPLWSWSEVSSWFVRNGLINAEESHNAAVLATINRVLEIQRQEQLQPGLIQQISRGLNDARVEQSGLWVMPELTLSEHEYVKEESKIAFQRGGKIAVSYADPFEAIESDDRPRKTSPN